MNNYPPVLAPAMELISQLQATVAAQQARINELSAMLGLAPLGIGKPLVVVKEDEPAKGDTKPDKVEAEKTADTVNSGSTPADSSMYTDQPLIIDGAGAFEAEYVNDCPNCYSLVVSGSRGTFMLNEAPEFYDTLAYALADMVAPVADYTVDDVPDGCGGFRMADLADCEIKNIEPGEILLDGPYWKVTKKAKVQFKVKDK